LFKKLGHNKASARVMPPLRKRLLLLPPLLL
jgi:hypothetical protein